MITLGYEGLYLLASPTAVVLNKMLMKDVGFGYPVVVSALGRVATMVGAAAAVRCCHVPSRRAARCPCARSC